MAVLQHVTSTEAARTKSSILEQAAWISGFAAMTAIGAQIEIPHQPIPFTLQTFFVLLSGAFLGARNGFYSQMLYLAAGAIGLPVFSGATFGLVKLFGFTGGYLMGFPVAAALIGYLLSHRSGYVWTLFSMFLGLTVIFSFGTLYLNFISIHDIQQSIVSGFLIFSWWDVLKLSAASAIYTELSKRFKKLPA
ncbi:MAG: biotin transporter BioY [Bacteroidota bacterium]